MKYLKLSGSLYLVGVQGGVTRFQPFSEYHDARKTGHNTELFGLTGGNPWVKETVEEIMEMLTLDLPVINNVKEVFVPAAPEDSIFYNGTCATCGDWFSVSKFKDWCESCIPF